MKKLITIVPYLLIAILVGVTIAYAGSLTPPGSAANTMYSLTDIYNLSAGTTATLGSGDIATTPTTVEATGYTLIQVYDALATEIAELSAGVIATGTNPFGITGAAVIALGNAVAANVLTGTTFSNATTANISGAMPTKVGSATIITPSTSDQTIAQGYYGGASGDGKVLGDADLIAGNIADGVNIFGVIGNFLGLDTSDATAVVGDILSPKTAYVNGSKITGTMSTQTLSSSSTTVNAGYYAGTTLTAVDADLVATNIADGVSIFGVTGSLAGGSTAAAPLKTGQTHCNAYSNNYNNGDYDNAVQIPCAGTSQDGESQNGVARSYTDNSNSTITDNSTGLMWQKCSKGLSGTDCGTGSVETLVWDDGNGNLGAGHFPAIDYCLALSLGSQTDWRLPNINELQSLVDYGRANPAINPTYFPNTQSGNYWSSTAYEDGASTAWLVYFYEGSVGSDGTDSGHYVRCVRG